VIAPEGEVERYEGCMDVGVDDETAGVCAEITAGVEACFEALVGVWAAA